MLYEQIQQIRNSCPVLDNVSDDDLSETLQHASIINFTSGEVVLEAGVIVDHAYLLLKGSLATLFKRDWGNDRVLEYIKVGDTLNEADLFNEHESQIEIKALEDSKLLFIPKSCYLRLITKHDGIIKELTVQAHEKTLRLLVMKYISELFAVAKLKITCPLLREKAQEEWLNFEDELLTNIQKTAKWVKLQRGEYLFHQNDESDSAYILASGLLRITQNLDGDIEHEINRVNYGEIVGEIGLITNKPRSANVIAMRDCELFCLPSQNISNISEKYPYVALNVYRTISERIKKSITHDPIQYKHSNITILTLSDNADIDKLINDFHHALSNIDTTELLSSHLVDEQLGRTGIANSSRNSAANTGLMRWLNGKEKKFSFLIYRADTNWSEWNWRCISQAEQILVFAEAKDKPRFEKIKHHLTTITGLCWNLVLVHDENTDRPRGSANWLTESQASEIYHVRHQCLDDIERIARIFTGNATSLVLGGGGARGFAHLGAIRVIEELGIKIDMVGGTSIGAPISGWIAQGHSASKCLQLAKQAFSSIIDWTIPLVSMINGRRISNSIIQQTGDWDIEDYWLPFFCVATNLTTANHVIHRRGNSAKAIRSSVSIPGMLPPVPHNGQLLVDGGVMNNLPIDIMRDINPLGTVIAFDVSPTNGPIAEEDYGLNLCGWRQLFKQLIPWKKPVKVPSIGVVIMQSMMVSSDSLRNQILSQKQADYYQNIHLNNIGLLDFNAVEEAEKIGYKNVIESLKKWIDDKNKTL